LRFSPDGRWLASAGQDGVVAVHRMPHASDPPVLISSSSNNNNKNNNCAVWLRGHAHAVVGVAWSPHAPDLLATASLDGLGKVWRLHPSESTATAVAVLRGHERRVLTIAWSGLDPGVVYTGGDDQTVRAWRPFAAAPRDEPTAATVAVPATAAKRPAPTATPTTKRAKRGNMVPSPAPAASASTATTAATATATGTTTTGVDWGLCRAVAEALGHIPPSSTLRAPSVADTAPGTGPVLVALAHAMRDPSNMASLLPQPHGPTAPLAVADALGRGQVTALASSSSPLSLSALAHAVALGPMAGLDAWRVLASTYAGALAAAQQTQAAASVWVALGRADRAVQLLQEQGHWHDALAVALRHLGPDDPLVAAVWAAYADAAHAQAQPAVAAACWAVVGDWSRTLEILAAAGCVEAWAAAADLADAWRHASAPAHWRRLGEALLARGDTVAAAAAWARCPPDLAAGLHAWWHMHTGTVEGHPPTPTPVLSPEARAALRAHPPVCQ
jgi:hypothetical protein